MADETPQLTVSNAAEWRAWLGAHHASPAGVWLTLAKKGVTMPTSLTYPEALTEALCHGWIDGQVRRRDETTYLQRFTPRRRRSSWSPTNVTAVERLTAAGRMHPAGLAEVERAKSDGRWSTTRTRGRRLTSGDASQRVSMVAAPTLTSRSQLLRNDPISSTSVIATSQLRASSIRPLSSRMPITATPA